jgi:AcrR family transcriptional regulator
MTTSQTTHRRLSRTEAKAETRRRLLDTAEAVFGRAGYHGASIDQVATEAGFTKGAIYSAFESKADLFLALLVERVTGRREEIESALAGTDSVDDFVAEVARRFGSSVVAEKDFWAALIEFMSVVGRDPELRDRFSAHHDESRDAVADSIRNWASRAGEAPALEPRRLATCVLALSNGLTLEGLLSPDDVDTQLYVEAHLAMLRGFRAAAPTEERGE